MGERDKATLIGFGAMLLWSALALMTAASGAIPPFELAALTFAVGGAAGLIYAAARGRLGALRQPPQVWLVGVGGLFGYHALYFAALRAAPPAQASLVAYLWPLLIVLMSAMLPGERLRAQACRRRGARASAARRCCCRTSSASAGRELGLALALGCAFVWSSYSIASRFLKATPTEAVAGFCLVTAALAARLPFRVRDDGLAGKRQRSRRHRRARPRAGRAGVLSLGLRRQARRHPPARRRRLRRAGAVDDPAGARRLRAGDGDARARLRGDRRRRLRRLALSGRRSRRQRLAKRNSRGRRFIQPMAARPPR